MARQNLLSVAVAVVAGLAPAFVSSAQTLRLGSEFQVNTYTPGSQRYAWVTTDADGDFVVVWQSRYQDGSDEGVFARRFSSAGAALGTELQVNTFTPNQQRIPSAAAAADGDFVVVWQSYGSQDGSSYGVFAQRYSSAGVTLGSELQVNTYTTNIQRFPFVAAEADGDFIVAWMSFGQDGSDLGIFAQRFSSAGAGLGGELQVNVYTTGAQTVPTVALDADGDFVVAWQSTSQDGSDVGIFARRFSSAGVGLGGEFQVNTFTAGAQRYQSVRADAEGDFVVDWISYGQDGADFGVFAQRFSSAGIALGGELQVNAFTPGSQFAPTIGMDDDGDFVVAWESFGRDGSDYGVFARRFSSAGIALNGEFQVNAYTVGIQSRASVAAGPEGGFVIAWQSALQDGYLFGVFAQRFTESATLDVDSNGALGALTDGLLILRFRFGFTGATLTSGAVGANCTRCDAAAIEPYLTALGLVLDVDGNGTLGALTDGLLVLRFLFGFTGATLTSGAVGGSCTRCDAPAIEAYLAGLSS